MGLFIKMEEAFAGTAFYQTYVSGWPPPFNIASFDVCLILLLILSFICPVIRDAIVERFRQKRELRWYREYQRKTAEEADREAMPQEQADTGDYFFDEEDTPDEPEPFAEDITNEFADESELLSEDMADGLADEQEGYGDTPNSGLYEAVYGDTGDVQEPALPEEFFVDYGTFEREALTEMELKGQEALTEMELGEQETLTAMEFEEEKAVDELPQQEDDFSRLMQKIRQTKEEKETAELLAQRQEESRLKNLDVIDRRLSEKMRREETVQEKGSTSQEAALEQAKRAAVNEKRAEMERRRQREQKHRQQTEKGRTKEGSHPHHKKQGRRMA